MTNTGHVLGGSGGSNDLLLLEGKSEGEKAGGRPRTWLMIYRSGHRKTWNIYLVWSKTARQKTEREEQ